MKFYFSKKEKWILSALSLLLVALTGLGYLFFIQSANTDLKIKEQSLQSQKKLLNAVMEKKARVKNGTVKSSTDLQKLLPVKPLVEQIVVDLGKAEVVSNSTIKTMAFGEGAVTPVEENSGQTASANDPPLNSTNNPSISSASSKPVLDQNGTTGQAAGQQRANSSLPAGVEKITVDLKIESATYEDLEKFLTTLENQKRITVIEKINFTGTKEITSLLEKEAPLIYNVTFSAYYMPGLKDLEKELPGFDTPPQSNKRNPLSKFADTGDPEQDDSQNNQ